MKLKLKWKLPKKTPYVIAAALVVLALIILVVLTVVHAVDTANTADPHAGHDHATETHATYNADLKPSDSYKVTENKDGTYNVEVRNRMGGVMYSQENLRVKPEFTQVDKHVLCITGREYKENNLSGWAVFCNIQANTIYRQPERVLATYENRVAYLDYRTDKFLVFVYAAFDNSVPLAATELTDLAIQQSGNPELEYSLSKNGDLKVTYATKDGKKTVTVEMGK